MTSRRASNSIVRAVKRRLLVKTPAAALQDDSVRRIPIPATQYEATLFIYELNGKLVLVAELLEVNLPHIYCAYRIQSSAKSVFETMTVALLGLSQKIQRDRRFRGNVIVLNGHAR